MARTTRPIRRALPLALHAGLLLGASSPALANPDRLEPGKQGETMPGEAHILAVPYTKGVDVVGHVDLGRPGNLITAWAGRCGYVAGGITMASDGSLAKVPHGPAAGVAVIDAGDPAAPKLVRFLQDKGALDAAETISAVDIPGRAVLAASTYGGVAGINGPKEGWLDLYDVSDCVHPRLMAELTWPDPTHTITLAPNGRRLYGTVLNPFTGAGGIEVMDISDLAHPRFLGKFEVTRPDGTSYAFAPHEISISPDERRIYAGVIASQGGDLNIGVRTMPPNAAGLGPEAGGIYIFDNRDIVDGKDDPKLRLIGTDQHGGWHSAIQAHIGGQPYLVGAGELEACPGSWPRLSTIADEKNPHVIGQFRLAMNIRENCPAPDAAARASGGIVGSPGTAASHFNDVDSSSYTHIGLFPFLWAGLRIADLRDPANPVEVAYFKPGNACMSHVRYAAKTGLISFACQDSGYWIIRLRPELRRQLGMRGPGPALSSDSDRR